MALEPSYRPSDSEVSPRVRSAFAATASHAAGNHPAEIRDGQSGLRSEGLRHGCGWLRAGLGDVERFQTSARPQACRHSADLRTLAGGFRDLAVTASAPPPPPPVAAPPAPEPPPVRPEPKLPPVSRIYGAEDGNVLPPSVLRQTLPPFPSRAFSAAQGALAVVIDERGSVESASMLAPLGQPSIGWSSMLRRRGGTSRRQSMVHRSSSAGWYRSTSRRHRRVDARRAPGAPVHPSEHRQWVDRRARASRNAKRRNNQHELPAIEPGGRLRQLVEVYAVEQVDP